MNEALRSNPAGPALNNTSHRDPSIRSLVNLQQSSLTSGMHVYSASPKMEAWEASAQMTVLGDAIHLMSPSGGVGAVAAINDAAALAQVIADQQGVPSVHSVSKIEQTIRYSARVCLRRSFAAGEKMLNTMPAEKCNTVTLR